MGRFKAREIVVGQIYKAVGGNRIEAEKSLEKQNSDIVS
jgi:hypothetical protein